MDSQYKAIGFVVIESIWPDTKGVDSGGLNPKGTQDEGALKSKLKKYVQMGSDNPDATLRGYYRIMPLNILSVQTTVNTSSPESNSFSASFTLDDLIMVTTEGKKDNPFLGSSGFVAKLNDIVPDFSYANVSRENAVFFDYLNISGATNSSYSGAFYINYHNDKEGDSRLQTGRLRINGGQTQFSIEDLVSPMDTVSIWLYHDYADFLVPDLIKVDEQGGFKELREFSHVIGSGDRKRQFAIDNLNEVNSFLDQTGIINKYLAQSISNTQSGKTNKFSISDDSVNDIGISTVDASFYYQGNLDEETNDVVTIGNARSETDIANNDLNKVARVRLLSYLKSLFPEEKNILMIHNYLVELFNYSEKIKDVQIDELGVLKLGGVKDPQAFRAGQRLFKSNIETMGSAYMRELTSGGAMGVESTQSGRVVLTTKTHGETSYLAFRGHIKTISSNVQAGNGGYTVTLSGAGMEYPLSKSIVFYDELLINQTGSILADFNVTYSRLSSARVIMYMINRWAPKKIKFGATSKSNEAQLRIMEINIKGKPKILLRGYIVPDKDASLNNENTAPNVSVGNSDIKKMRIFNAINYLDTHRINEIVRAMDNVDPTGRLGSQIGPFVPQPKQSIMSNLKGAAGPSQLFEFFVDESGRLMYRMTFEAWERTPEPVYTPTLEDEEVISVNFQRTDEEVVTVMDVIPASRTLSNFQSSTDNNSSSRALPRLTTLPMNSPTPEDNASASMYRYGLRYNTVQDYYSSISGNSRSKAYGLLRFFENPMKRAEVKVLNNTAYRAGNTVLLNLESVRKRSHSVINVDDNIKWLENIIADEDLLKAYIGVDYRLIKGNSIYKSKTFNVNKVIEQTSWSNFVQTPEKEVALRLLKTFKWLKLVISNDNGEKLVTNQKGDLILTPEFFPSTVWYYLGDNGKANNNSFRTKDGSIILISAKDILSLHASSIRIAVGLGDQSDINNIKNLTTKYPTIVESMDFQNTVATSYYIQSVTHNYDYGTQALTSLSLIHGQDNVLIKDPSSHLILGFFSVERKIRLQHPDPLEWEEMKLGDNGVYMDLYKEQGKQERQFKDSSFMWQSQKYRNVAQYMHKLATKIGDI